MHFLKKCNHYNSLPSALIKWSKQFFLEIMKDMRSTWKGIKHNKSKLHISINNNKPLLL